MKKIACWVVCLMMVSRIAGVGAVRVEGVPEGGLQPEVVTDGRGVVHLVYLRGDPKAAEVRYTWRRLREPWQPSVTVNSQLGSGMAMGSIRGPQLALVGKGGVQVLWNGAAVQGRSPLWLAGRRAGERSFAEQRDLLGDGTALDGGASIAADGAGGVFVVWHGNRAGEGAEEQRRLVFVRTSKDGGETFGEAVPVNAGQPGVCACCSLRALAGGKEGLRIFFRSAVTMETRTMTLLSQAQEGWSAREVEPWKVAACPMSSAALAVDRDRLLGAWETAGQIRVGWISTVDAPAVTVATASAKHPVAAISSQGKVLLAWLEGSGWNRGGSAVWQELDLKLRAVGSKGTAPGVPAWGRVAVYAEPQGDFVVLK